MQIGEKGTNLQRSLTCSPCSPITPRHRFQSIALSNVVPTHVENFPENGLARQPLRGAFSMYQHGELQTKAYHGRPDRKLSRESEPPHLRVYVTNDTSDVYEDQLIRAARDDTGHFQPTLILLGLRLGIDNVTSVYWDGLRAALQWPQSVGVAGYVPPQRKPRETG